jgi:hypothetical protein
MDHSEGGRSTPEYIYRRVICTGWRLCAIRLPMRGSILARVATRRASGRPIDHGHDRCPRSSRPQPARRPAKSAFIQGGGAAEPRSAHCQAPSSVRVLQSRRLTAPTACKTRRTRYGWAPLPRCFLEWLKRGVEAASRRQAPRKRPASPQRSHCRGRRAGWSTAAELVRPEQFGGAGAEGPERKWGSPSGWGPECPTISIWRAMA